MVVLGQTGSVEENSHCIVFKGGYCMIKMYNIASVNKCNIDMIMYKQKQTSKQYSYVLPPAASQF